MLKNQGIYLLVDHAEFARDKGGIGRLKITLSDVERHGIVNGGHTYAAIRDAIEHGDDNEMEIIARAWVVVREHPFYTITGDDGGFTLDNVPPGRHTLDVWQVTMGRVTMHVTVTDGGPTVVMVEMAPQ